MSTAIVEESKVAVVPQANGDQPIVKVRARLPFDPVVYTAFGISQGSWKALVEAIFPNAQSTESVVLALSYCRARNLDPFKRNVHIVPIWNKDLRRTVDTIWPGIGELRTTAFRTGEYAGRDNAEWGESVEQQVGKAKVKFHEWCQVTVYRIVRGQRMAFAGPKVYWLETYSTKAHDDDTPNEMWATRVNGQHEKCAEAAALRAAFPEEIGSDYIADEVRGSTSVKREDTQVKSLRERMKALPEVVVEASPAVDDTHQPSPEPDVPHIEPEAPPADAPPDVSTWEKTDALAMAAAQDSQLAPSELARSLGLWLIARGCKGKPDKTTAADRLELVLAVRSGRLKADGTIA